MVKLVVLFNLVLHCAESSNLFYHSFLMSKGYPYADQTFITVKHLYLVVTLFWRYSVYAKSARM